MHSDYVMGTKISSWVNESVLELDSGNGCTTL